MPAVKFADLLDGFEFSSFGGSEQIVAYIGLDSGTVYLTSSEQEFEAASEIELPADIHTSDRYVAIPGKNDLDLGRDLALSFVRQHLADDYETVFAYFTKRGAYARFKNLLDDRNAMERWYEHQRVETEIALRAWCKDNDIELAD